MNPDLESPAARRYLLGQASDEECSAIEREYFDNDVAGDQIAAAEEDLIEDYLGERLTGDERRRFDAHYLASPQHRRRVEMIRRLGAMAGDSGHRSDVPAGPTAVVSPTRLLHRPYQWLALAAALVMVVGALWALVPRRHDEQARSENPPAPAPNAPQPTVAEPRSTRQGGPPAAAPRLFAFSLSPVSVRSANDSSTLVIPTDTDVVALRLEGDTDRATIANASVAMRTVAGEEVWRGKAAVPGDAPDGAVARVDIPASRLPANDYVVVLFATNAAGVEQERYRYFLRVRSR